MMMADGRTEAEEQEDLRRQIQNFENDPSVIILIVVVFVVVVVVVFEDLRRQIQNFENDPSVIICIMLIVVVVIVSSDRSSYSDDGLVYIQ